MKIKMKSKIEKKLSPLFVNLTLVLSAYQVSICWIGYDNLRSKESAISNRESLWIE